ncbi:MAG: 2-C-methyl-D-erythritol 4-phosphate cytidylyltransferase [Terrimicrobiaceae bacterium]
MKQLLPTLDVILVAGGSSRRMGFDKLLAPLGGRSMIAHALSAFNACDDVRRVVVVCPAGRREDFEKEMQGFPRVFALVEGGAERSDSVMNGIHALESEGESLPDFVAVHDAARPLVLPESISLCFHAAIENGAAALAEKVVDTLHRCDDKGIVLEPVSRTNLWRVQTPQILRWQDLKRLSGSTTDEVSGLLRLGKSATMIANPHPNFKMTLPADLVLAEAIIQARSL